ncbi:MAG: molybdopterin-synthase adenylyltransferase MoeB [Candidatus Kariarchaeaceae archaeon]|jgi:adenylyltransferase/sulfurtransferase
MLNVQLKSPLDHSQKSSLSQEEVSRYSRHLILPEVGIKGQEKLKLAKVLLIGAGGLGSPLALYLAAAGVGTIGIVDYDVVDITNLQRQIIHSTEDIGKPKLDSTMIRLQGINPEIKIINYNEQLTSDNALDIIREYDIVADGTDNFPTRYLVNDACVLLGKPNVYASIFRFEGQASVFYGKEGPCYRCLYAEPPPPGLVPSCAEGGVLGVLPGIVGTLQATEVIKLILGIGEPLIGRLLLIDALDMKFRELKCGKNPTITELIDYYEFCGLGTSDEQDLIYQTEDSITVEGLAGLLDSGKPLQLIDVREPHEQQISKISNSVLMPQNDVVEMAKALDNNQITVVYCRTGKRSGKAVNRLKEELGFTKILNLIGGINEWVTKVDPNQPIY